MPQAPQQSHSSGKSGFKRKLGHLPTPLTSYCCMQSSAAITASLASLMYKAQKHHRNMIAAREMNQIMAAHSPRCQLRRKHTDNHVQAAGSGSSSSGTNSVRERSLMSWTFKRTVNPSSDIKCHHFDFIHAQASREHLGEVHHYSNPMIMIYTFPVRCGSIKVRTFHFSCHTMTPDAEFTIQAPTWCSRDLRSNSAIWYKEGRGETHKGFHSWTF